MILLSILFLIIWSLLLCWVVKRLSKKHNDSIEIILDYLIRDADELKKNESDEKRLDEIRNRLRILKDELKGIL